MSSDAMASDATSFNGRAEPRRRRVLLVGQGPTAASALSGLLAGHDVVSLVRAAGPGDEAVRLAGEAGVPLQPDATTAGVADLVTALQPDCVVVSSFSRILPPDLLASCAFLNVHYSALPRYRGRANVNWAVINGETEAAISLHELVAELDAGDVLYQERIPVGPRTTAGELYVALNAIQERELAAAVTRLLSGDGAAPQDDSQATFGCSRIPTDGELQWTTSTQDLDRLVRGLSQPWPGAYTFRGLQKIWVDDAEPSPDSRVYEGRVPGRVVRVSRSDGWVDVLTGDGALRLHRLRLEDGPPVDAAAELRSVRETLGLRSSDLVDELVRLRRRIAELGGE